MSFFKAYDMRGTFRVDFDPEMVYRVGRALPGVVGGRRWLVGRDVRESSPLVHDALVSGLSEAGAEVTDIGLCTTPMVYFFTAEDGYDGSVMITASHNPSCDNGLKVSKRSALPVGYANGLAEVEARVSSDRTPYRPAAVMPVSASQGCWLERYVAWQRRMSDDTSFSSLSYAVDCSNGMAALLARDLFPGAVILNEKLDGKFPNHSPNPLKADAREQLAAIVREKGLDVGVIFDGDADRCMFVDSYGEFVQPDYLIPLVASAERTAPGATAPAAGFKVIHDVRTSRGAIEAIREMGCEPVMVPVGHAFAKPVLRESGALCGGELAGHYYFRSFAGCDSGVLAARRILAEIAAAKERGMSFRELMAPITGRYANSGELNFKVADKDEAIARVLGAAREKLPPEISRSEMDGIRLEYTEGWVNVRKSNTEPYLRLIVECDTSARLKEWTGLFASAIAG